MVQPISAGLCDAAGSGSYGRFSTTAESHIGGTDSDIIRINPHGVEPFALVDINLYTFTIRFIHVRVVHESSGGDVFRSGSFVVFPDGSSAGVRILSSSGSQVLDNAAVRSVKKASPFPRFPEKITSFQMQMEFSMIFRLGGKKP